MSTVEVGPDSCPSPFVGVAKDRFGKFTAILLGHLIGNYGSARQAAIAHDMEALSAYGPNIEANNLNFAYILSPDPEAVGQSMPPTGSSALGYAEDTEPLTSASMTNMTSMVVTCKDSSVGVEGTTVLVCGSPDVYEPVLAPRPLPVHAQIATASTENGIATSSQVQVHCNAPPPADPAKPLVERLNTVCHPSTSYVFDVHFPSQASLGINLAPHHVVGGSSLVGPGLGAAAVEGVIIPALPSAVRRGDVLVSVNNTPLFGPADKWTLADCTQPVTSTKPPRVVRFIRPTGSGVNSVLSPVELQLALTAAPVAQYSLDTTADETVTLKLGDLDKTLPSHLRDFMFNRPLSWEESCAPQGLSDAELLASGYRPGKQDNVHTILKLGRNEQLLRDARERDKSRDAAFSRRGNDRRPQNRNGALMRPDGRGAFVVEVGMPNGDVKYCGKYEQESSADRVRTRLHSEMLLTSTVSSKRPRGMEWRTEFYQPRGLAADLYLHDAVSSPQFQLTPLGDATAAPVPAPSSGAPPPPATH